MIGYLSGKIISKTNKTLLIDVNGIGYSVFCSNPTIQQNKIGQETKLYIHTHVREDALELYGMATAEETEFFKQMIGISGVGPKSALGIFEVAKLGDIKKAIAHGDPSLLTKVSGIGKKTAELIIIKLKDKNVVLDLSGDEIGSQSEAIDALMGLGYSASDARTALAKVDSSLESTEEKIKAALKLLAK